jgi:adenylyltransferase/sulfurtransferase
MSYSLDGFSDNELDYYSRQIVLRDFGIQAQRRLKAAKVCLVGAGGLGSPISIQLTSIGIGHLRIIDRDVVEMSNLQRQHLYGIDKIGIPKVEAAAERLGKLNPFVKIEPIPMSLTPGNAETLLDGFDLVVDGLDTMTARYAVNRACQKLGIPYVFGAVITQVGNASTIIPGKTACLECFQGNVDDDSLPGCSILGVHPSIISLLASVEVSEAVRLLMGKDPVLANKLLFCDLKELSIGKIHLAKLETCPVCGKSNKPPFTLKQLDIEEICGRENRRVFIFSPDASMQLDLTSINEKIKNQGYIIKTASKLGTTFMKDEVKASILVSGVTIMEGVENVERAKFLRSQLLGG